MQTQGIKVAQAFLNRAEEEGRSGRKTNRMLALPVVHQLRLALNDLEELHPKAALVDSLVVKELVEKPEGKVLIFTEYRDSVARLVSLLNVHDGVEADAFIGQSSRGTQKGMTQKQQLAQLQRFRSGEINVLVATSVGEEGLDVPAADLVVLYEPVPSAVRAIQRRGRTARQRAGSVHVLIAKNTRDAYVHRASERQEENMHRLMGRLVRQKQLNENYIVNDQALSAFSIETGEETVPAKTYLEEDLAKYAQQKTAEENPIESNIPKRKSAERVAPDLRADQLRPQTQSSLFAFEQEEKENVQRLDPQAVEAVLNAADREIISLNEVDGQENTIYIDHRDCLLYTSDAADD